MAPIILIYGLIGGTIIAILSWVLWSVCMQDLIDLDRGQLLGYASMVIALSMIFFGIKSYRDNRSGGVIKFWKAVQIGLLITTVCSLMYVASGEVISAMYPGFTQKVFDKFVEHETGKLARAGAAAEEIEKKRAEMSEMVKIWENPFTRFGIYMIEIWPVGLIITFISAAILRKKEVLPAAPAMAS